MNLTLIGRVVLLFVLLGPHSVGWGDTESVIVRTVEWLVDNSDVIAITDDATATKPKILHYLKGDESKLVFPLKLYEPSTYRYYHSTNGGQHRLLFIKNSSELLSEIDIGRSLGHRQVSTFFGFSQFGKPLTSEAELIRLIGNRLQTKVEGRLPIRSGLDQINTTGAFVAPPKGFFLDTSEEVHLLEVPFTVERKKHYLKLVQTSSYVPEAIEAIYQLSHFEADEVAINSVKSLARRDGIVPGYVESTPGSFKLITSKNLSEVVEWYLSDTSSTTKSK